jgi:hypothetical protein
MTDLSNWLTEAEAAARLGTTDRTIQRWCEAGKGPERRKRPVPGRKAETVYNPDDVARMAETPPAVFSPGSALVPRDPGPGSALVLRDPEPDSRVALVLGMLQEWLQSQQPKKRGPWLTLKEASDYSGFSMALLRRLIAAEKLPTIWDGSIKVSQADLDNLDIVGMDVGILRIGGRAPGRRDRRGRFVSDNTDNPDKGLRKATPPVEIVEKSRRKAAGGAA